MNSFGRFTIMIMVQATILLCCSCTIESASQKSAKTITIATDYLNYEDTILFESFTRKTGIAVELKIMTADELLSFSQKAGFNSDIDVVMMASMYDVHQLNNSHQLQLIPETLFKDSLRFVHSSKDRNFITFGLEPYVIQKQSDTISNLNMYEDLITSYSVHSLSRKELIPFLSGFYFSEKRVDGNQKIIEFIQNVRYSKGVDTMHYSLRLNSSFVDTSDIVNDRPFITPSATFYNLRTFGILNQSNDYQLAIHFVKYFTEKSNNKRLCKNLEIVDLSTDLANISTQKHLPNRLMHHYFQIERILKANHY